MKNTTLLFALLAIAVMSACRDHNHNDGPTTSFDITFQATFDGAQLEKNKDYQLGSIPFYVEAFRMYLSDITLLKGSEEVRLSEIEYLDFTPSNATFATPKITFTNVPEGEYTGIRIGYGVKPSLNAKRPADFPAGHPLAVENDYWAGWNSYIFTTLDGKADPDNNGSKNLGLAYHSGSDAVYKTFDFVMPIHVHAGEAGARITFDIKEYLTLPNGTFYDIAAHPATSNSASDVTVAQVLSANFGRATTVAQ